MKHPLNRSNVRPFRFARREVVTPTGVLACALAASLAGALTTPVEAPAQTTLDNYKCYRVRDPLNFRGMIEMDSLRTEFDLEPACRIIGRAKLYCVPAGASVVSIQYPGNAPGSVSAYPGQEVSQDRTCYKVKCPSSARVAPTLVEDMFGRRQLDKFKVEYLCTSAGESPDATTTTIVAPTSTTTTTTVAPPLDPDLLTVSQIETVGSFRLPATTYGTSSLNFSEGPIEYDAASHSMFVVGHSHHQAIAQFAVPALVQSSNLADLNMTGAPLQDFGTILGRGSWADPDNVIDRIGGLELLDGPNGPELMINAYEYYDAPADNWLTTMVLHDATDMAGSTADGYFALTGAAHASGWISPIPAAWQSSLGGTHISGHSSGIPIIGRASVGPSAFAFNPAAMLGATPDASTVPANTLLDYSLGNPIHSDLSNSSGNNNVWTHLSRAVYGLIVPGTRTYLAIGYSGGHNSGVGYKITQDNGNLCGGYCSYEVADNYTYYWAFDMNDLLAVRQGTIAAHSVQPYARGQFPVPFPVTEIGGGTFDPASGLLYLTLQRADTAQGTYSNPPVVTAYRFLPGSGS